LYEDRRIELRLLTFDPPKSAADSCRQSALDVGKCERDELAAAQRRREADQDQRLVALARKVVGNALDELRNDRRRGGRLALLRGPELAPDSAHDCFNALVDRRLEAGELVSIGNRSRAARNGRDLESGIGEGRQIGSNGRRLRRQRDRAHGLAPGRETADVGAVGAAGGVGLFAERVAGGGG